MTLAPNTRFALLYYKIPTGVMRNPASMLRRFGVTVDGSVWILPVKNIVLIPIKKWRELGVTAEVVEFNESELPKVIAIARRAISNDLDSMRAHVEKSVAEVRKRFKAVDACPTGSTERDEARKHAEHFAYVVLYRAKGIADAAEECALHFDLTGDVEPLVDGLRRTIKAKAAIFYGMQEQARATTQQSLAVTS